MKYNINFPSLVQEFNRLNFNILENGLYIGDTNWSFRDIVSSYNRMYFFMEGSAYIENESGRHYLQPGYIYMIPAGTTYNYVCTSKMQKFYLHFELHLLPGVDLFEGITHYLSIPFQASVLDEMLELSSSDSLSDILYLKATLLQFVAKFMSTAYEKEDFSTYFLGYYKQKDVLDYIKSNLSSSLKIQSIAEALDRPYHTLSRNFKQDTGMGIKSYIEKRLLQRAKSLLLSTNLSIAEIANELSFCDAYYFSKFFKKAEAVSPSEYRNRHLIKLSNNLSL
ncbi:MAG: AraC family transcriptional regulator [Lachnospiraceae bacterium]